MIFYRISELMLPTLIQKYDKNNFISSNMEPLIFNKIYGYLKVDKTSPKSHLFTFYIHKHTLMKIARRHDTTMY